LNQGVEEAESYRKLGIAKYFLGVHHLATFIFIIFVYVYVYVIASIAYIYPVNGAGVGPTTS
jgi:hypothetical protein